MVEGGSSEFDDCSGGTSIDVDGASIGVDGMVHLNQRIFYSHLIDFLSILILQGGAKKTPTDIHPHKMARKCWDNWSGTRTRDELGMYSISSPITSSHILTAHTHIFTYSIRQSCHGVFGLNIVGTVCTLWLPALP